MKNKIFLLLIFFTILNVNSAYIYKIKGDVFYRDSSNSQWKKLYDMDENMPVKNGYEIRTSRASSVEIFMDDGSKIKLAPTSFFKLENEDKSESTINLFTGKIRNWVKKFSKKYVVKTPTAVCAVRGTDFLVDSDIEGNTKVEVYDGSVLTADSKGMEAIVKKGEFIEITKEAGLGILKENPNPPQNMDSSIGDRKLMARKEIYNDISKESIIKQAQAEIQMSEYQNGKTAIDAFGNRVRIEEYIVRPAENQFKYVVLNTREKDFNFGKILFTFNTALPEDLTLVTKNMISYEGSSQPKWYLTELNSVISNTLDKVTEDASGGHMVPDDTISPTRYDLFFTNYAVYAAGPSQANENGGLGRLLWKYSDTNNNNIADASEFTYLGGIAPTTYRSNPMGDNVFNNIVKNTYSDGTWIQAQDFVLFDDGKIVSTDDLASRLGISTKNDLIDKLNFEKVYTSSLFEGRSINLEFSAKLLKDCGMIRF